MSDNLNQPTIEKPESSRESSGGGNNRWLLFGGLGCGAVLALVAVLVGLAYWTMGTLTDNPEYLASKIKVENSQEVKEQIGSPLTFGKQKVVLDPDQQGKFTFHTDLTGPNGTGKMIWSGTMSTGDEGPVWETGELMVETSEGSIDLMAEPDPLGALNIDAGG